VGRDPQRLWEETGDHAALDEGISPLERGFFMKKDSFTGINYAFMLDDRAHLETDKDEATANRVLARRVWRQLVETVDAGLKRCHAARTARSISQ
jgi:hypothetical protein